ncbi:hypothetical protein [Neisseria sp. 83E34]|uniref:hypothetical protein n=1 Tax=Neisseria sp. 83E34 TaxID=1692264 RepID=UPI000A407FAC|nr:hypothetical protein [Neisseria sp. 83E34]
MNNQVQDIISEVFRLTGVRLTPDDPVVAVLLILEQSLKAAFSDFAADQAKVSESFLERIAEHEKNITDAAARLETYREQLLVELAQHADRQMEEAEGKIYAAVSARVVKDIETANAAFLDNLKKLLMFASAAWGFGILLLVCGLIFK